MRRCAAAAELAEHPFGTLKCRAGYRHFLVRGFNKVRGEWSLMALCYNFSRVLNIVGLGELIAYFAKRAGKSSFLPLLRASQPLSAAPERSWRAFGPRSAQNPATKPPPLQPRRLKR